MVHNLKTQPGAGGTDVDITLDRRPRPSQPGVTSRSRMREAVIGVQAACEKTDPGHESDDCVIATLAGRRSFDFVGLCVEQVWIQSLGLDSGSAARDRKS